MLRSTKDLENYSIEATDGHIGHLKDVYFDDDAWVIRYFVVETGSWLTSRKVLISPISIHHPEWLNRSLPAAISKDQVRSSPAIDTDKPVSRQHEEELMGYYGYPYYWQGNGMWGEGIYPNSLEPGFADNRLGGATREQEERAYLLAEAERHRNDDPHLRSCNAVEGYHIHASNGEIGHVSGFLVDDATWAIRYLIVDTSNWWIGRKVLIAPEWITGVHWVNETVSVDLSRESIKHAPIYDPEVDWSLEQDIGLYRYYGRREYWSGSTMLETET